MKKTKSVEHQDEISEIVKAILEIGYTQGINNAFTTFLEMLAISISCHSDPIHCVEREKRYAEIEKGLTPELVKKYAGITALMFKAAIKNMDAPIDILGAVYHRLNLNNEWSGQFFTPDNVCRMMALMINPIPTPEQVGKEIVTINEPTCGSGTMVIAAAYAMNMNKVDYKTKCMVVAQDLDIRCVWMAYIQLSLYEIPAVVIHQNTLTGEQWSKWYTVRYWAVAQKLNREAVA